MIGRVSFEFKGVLSVIRQKFRKTAVWLFLCILIVITGLFGTAGFFILEQTSASDWYTYDLRSFDNGISDATLIKVAERTLKSEGLSPTNWTPMRKTKERRVGSEFRYFHQKDAKDKGYIGFSRNKSNEILIIRFRFDSQQVSCKVYYGKGVEPAVHTKSVGQVIDLPFSVPRAARFLTLSAKSPAKRKTPRVLVV